MNLKTKVSEQQQRMHQFLVTLTHVGVVGIVVSPLPFSQVN